MVDACVCVQVPAAQGMLRPGMLLPALVVVQPGLPPRAALLPDSTHADSHPSPHPHDQPLLSRFLESLVFLVSPAPSHSIFVQNAVPADFAVSNNWIRITVHFCPGLYATFRNRFFLIFWLSNRALV